MQNLDALLRPNKIALIGASKNFNKLNGRPLKFLLEHGYEGTIYPVNPNYKDIAGLACFPSVSETPEPADLAIVALPAKLVANSLREIASAGIPAAVVFSSGFGETDKEGEALERELRDIIAETGLLLCGPNTLGLVNSHDRVMATFSQYGNGSVPSGPIGFVTQSGAFGTAIAALARDRGQGLGYFVNTGNEVGLDFSEVMASVLSDDRITVGAGYLEGVTNGEGFISLAELALNVDKPLVITKVGRTKVGALAAASHTGSLAGEDAVFDGLCQQYGVIRASDESSMLDVVEALSAGARPLGPRVGLITQSGGAGVLMADRSEELGLTVASLSAETTSRLREVVPAFGSVGNPVDITAQFIAEPEIFQESVKAVLADPCVDFGVVWFQLMHEFVDDIRQVFENIRESMQKPLLVVWVAGPPEGHAALRELGFPVYGNSSGALESAAALVSYQNVRSRGADKSLNSKGKLDGVSIPATCGVLSSSETRDILTAAGVPLTPTSFCADATSAVEQARSLGYPVALKVESPDIGHKSDIGGVCLGLTDDEAVKAAFRDVTASAAKAQPNARIQGALVQSMDSQNSVELVVGLKRDVTFGMVVMVGMGGITLEVIPDVAFRKAPVTHDEAQDMLASLKGSPLLNEVRGRPPVNRNAVADLVVAVSQLGSLYSDRIAELDLNPVRAGANGVLAVDWLLTTTDRQEN